MYKFIKHIILLIIMMNLLSINQTQAMGKITENSEMYEWVFIYYMSYDNNLSPLGETILKDIGDGIISMKSAVVVQADFRDTDKMKRISMRYNNGVLKREEITLESGDSSDENEYKKYLIWVQENWKSNNYAIVFLNHGGTLNNMCFDEKLGKWLNAFKTGKICRDFNQNIGNKVRLLFLQQCGRGSLENIYNFLDSADYIMASPVKVGAPNTYYSQLLKSTAKNTELTGADIAQIIMDEDQHYTIYTLVKNNELKKLPENLTTLFNSIKRCNHLKFGKSLMKVFQFDDEINYDVKSFIEGIKESCTQEITNTLNQFIDWYEKKLIVKKGIKSKNRSQYSGLSIHIPSKVTQVNRYNYLPIYQETNIEDIMNLLITVQSENNKE